MNNYVHKLLDSTVGTVFGKDITCREPIHRCDDYQPGVLVEFGRTGVRLFKKFLMPCGLCAAVPAMKPTSTADNHTTPNSIEPQTKKLVKPSELPIYTVEDGYTKQMPCIEYPSIVEDNIRKVRQTVQEIKSTLSSVSNNVTSTVEQFKYIIDYLQDEANLMPRIGAVGIGGLSGLIFGLRAGMFKRLLYTTTGASIIGCICFPKETKQALSTVERYGTISCNFIYGVKPGDEPKEVSLTEFPLLKTVFESEYFRMITEPFKHKAVNTAEKLEEKPLASKTEKGKE